LFANGQPHPAPAALAQRVCGEHTLAFEAMPHEDALSLLLALVNDGHLVLHKPRR
jgi:50S ribosomal protein L16 3-hydroxylase